MKTFICHTEEGDEGMSNWLNELRDNHKQVEIAGFSTCLFEGSIYGISVLVEVWD